MSSPDLALRTHAREELGIDPSATGSPWRAAGSSLASFAIGAFIPLAPWVFTTSGNPVVWSIVLAAIALFAVGGLIGWFTRNGIIRWGFRQLAIGGLAALVTFGIGRAVGATLSRRDARTFRRGPREIAPVGRRERPRIRVTRRALWHPGWTRRRRAWRW